MSYKGPYIFLVLTEVEFHDSCPWFRGVYPVLSGTHSVNTLEANIVHTITWDLHLLFKHSTDKFFSFLICFTSRFFNSKNLYVLSPGISF